MTQARCQVELGATVRQVADDLRKLFGPLLGLYKRPDGPPIQAFWTVGKGQVRPSYTATGIEAVLTNAPERELLGPPSPSSTPTATWRLCGCWRSAPGRWPSNVTSPRLMTAMSGSFWSCPIRS